MILYAIRQKSTGFYLPRFTGRAGQTFMEPEKGCIPRLFKTERMAQTSLTWWLKGKVEPKYEEVDYGFTRGTEMVGWKPVPVPERSADDMEVVPMILIRDIHQ